MAAAEVAKAPPAAEEADGPETSTMAIGVIQPPPDIKNIVDKTAGFVAKNGPQFEQRILTNERNTSKFGFLQPTSPYWPYYQKKLAEAKAGIAPGSAPMPPPAAPAQAAAGKEGEGDGAKASAASVGAAATVAKKKELKEPPKDVYTVLPPDGLSIPTMDTEIIKLTAQYVAVNGRSFLNGLLTRESRNPQFDFLKGHHFLFNYFTALVESYTKVLNPPEEVIQKLKKDAVDRVDILEQAFSRLDWDAHTEKERQRAEDQAAREKEQVIMIDWHDFKVVQTIDFDDADEDLPPPLTEDALKSLKLTAAAQDVPELAKPSGAPGAGAQDDGGGDMEMDEGGDMDMDEDEGTAEQEAEQPPPPPEDDTPMNIVKNYQKPGAPQQAAAATKFMISPITGQQIPMDQMAEHMRIALLDPKWKEKSGLVKQGEKEDTIAVSDEIGSNLKRLANKRKDIFGTDEEVFGDGSKPPPKKPAAAAGKPEAAQKTGAMSADAQKDAARVLAMRQQAQMYSEPPPPPPQQPPAPDVNSIIANAQQRMGAAGAPPPPPPAAGRGIPPPPPAGGPPPQISMPGQAGRGMPPPFGGQPGMMPPGVTPPGGMPHPYGQQQPPPPPPQQQGVPPPPAAAPPPAAPTPPVPQAPAAPVVNASGLMSEQDWVAKSGATVQLKVVTPSEEENSKFNFDGRTVSVSCQSMSTVKVLKEQLQEQLGGLAANKQKITSLKHGVLKDNMTLASYNFSNGDSLTVATKARGGKK